MVEPLKPYSGFREAIGQRESAGKYDCVNKLGYLGKYQFGMARLCDLGLTLRKPDRSGFSNAAFEWKEPFTQAGFLNNPKLQDDTFDLHVQLLARICEKISPENLSGAIAGCHLLGVGGLDAFVRHRIDECDAFGTKFSEYYELFRGYKIPEHPQSPDPGPIKKISIVAWDSLGEDLIA